MTDCFLHGLHLVLKFADADELQ